MPSEPTSMAGFSKMTRTLPLRLARARLSPNLNIFYAKCMTTHEHVKPIRNFYTRNIHSPYTAQAPNCLVPTKAVQ